MELNEEKQCFRYKEVLYGNLNITHDETGTFFVLWNKYQIFIHEGLDFNNTARILTTEFQIYQVLVSNNYLVCLDCNGYIHTISLKTKHSSQKRFRSCFQPREKGILQSILYNSDSTLSLQHEFDEYFICHHKINSEFQVENKLGLNVVGEHWPVKPNQGDCIICIEKITKEDFTSLKVLFGENVWKDHRLLIITSDKRTVYACLYSQKCAEDTASLMKLYASPTEICDLKIMDAFNIYIVLTCGTLVHLSLKERTKSPGIIHLNTAITKLMSQTRDVLIYTDGQTLWKTQNVYSKDNISFHQYFVKDIKDFAICGDLIICTTFSNLIYTFPENLVSNCGEDGYSPASKLLNNSEYLYKVMEEIEKNKHVIDSIECERDYLTAVALSKRQDLMEKIIEENIIVYESYEDFIKDSTDTVLTEDFEHYFKSDVLLILITIRISVTQHNFNHILTNVFKNLNVHFTILTEEKVLKSTTVTVKEMSKEIQVLIPIERGNLTHIDVAIKFISEIPGPLDQMQTIPTIVYKNLLRLSVEHFLRTKSGNRKAIVLKNFEINIAEQIRNTAENHHGALYNFLDLSKPKNDVKELSYYVKLPENFKEILRDEGNYKNMLNSQKAEFLQKSLSSEPFLSSKSKLSFEIGNDKVYLSILNDYFCTPLMKIFSSELKVALYMRNFIANMVYKDINCGPGKEFIDNALYTTTENIQKALKSCSSSEEYLAAAEKFNKNVVGSLLL